jgi:hypothetical protein
MKFSFAGPSYHGTSDDLDAQRTINLYTEVDPFGKHKGSLVGTPGVRLFSDFSGLPVRGAIEFFGDVFAVAGNVVYRITSAGVPTALAPVLTTFAGPVSMAQNGLEIIIVDGALGYIWTKATSTLAQIVDVDFPNGATRVAFIDHYFAVNVPNSGRIQLCEPLAGTIWDPLRVKTAESDPDNVSSVIADQDYMYVAGGLTTEVWWDTGLGIFPFQRTSGGVITWGCPAPHAMARAPQGIVWLAKHAQAGLSVVQAYGSGEPRILSTPQLDTIISGYGTVMDAFAFSYHQNGHFFYQLTFPTANATWVYDFLTQQWHERSTYSLGRHLASCHAVIGNLSIVGSQTTGKLYYLDPDYFYDDAEQIRRSRVTPIFSDDDYRLRWDSIIADLEVGVGDATTTDPKVELEMSTDHGRTYGYAQARSIGGAGQYRKQVRWNRLGAAVDAVFRISIADPVKVRIFGGSAEVSRMGVRT